MHCGLVGYCLDRNLGFRNGSSCVLGKKGVVWCVCLELEEEEEPDRMWGGVLYTLSGMKLAHCCPGRFINQPELRKLPSFLKWVP